MSFPYFGETVKYKIARSECSFCSISVISLVKMAVVHFQQWHKHKSVSILKMNCLCSDFFLQFCNYESQDSLARSFVL